MFSISLSIPKKETASTGEESPSDFVFSDLFYAVVNVVEVTDE